jgi:protein involved in polysaccharide export with SLBB domain
LGKALILAGGLTNPPDDRNQNRRKDSDDRNDSEEFDQGER